MTHDPPAAPPRAANIGPVAVLGAGINGCAVARELAINGVPVWLIDAHDIAYGATARSSRLIHGGLRYLEYRDFALVRESLAERERLLQTAPQFVTPLRLRIPVNRLLGGLWSGALKFSGLAQTTLGQQWAASGSRSVRGMLAVSFGLEIYDWLAGDSSLPGHRVQSASSVSGLTPEKHWVCEYSDCQMLYPERFVLALLADAERAATVYQRAFEVRLHRCVRLEGETLLLTSATDVGDKVEVIEPSYIINATGAWGDETLQALGHSQQPPLLAGTKGTHLFTLSPTLKSLLQGFGIYAEANDGRLIFILPCGDGTLIGTTDEAFKGDPSVATATLADVTYLIDLVNSLFPQLRLTAADIEMQHAGVRPLPNVTTASTASIPRGHSIVPTTLGGIPLLTLVGGKLTTCRALAEEVTDTVLKRLNLPRRESSARRLVPGAEGYPTNEQERPRMLAELARRYRLSPQQVAVVWRLVGNRFSEVFVTDDGTDREKIEQIPRTSLVGTSIPLDFVRWSIRREWATTLEDLVERRLLLIFHPQLTRETLQALAIELIAANQLAPINAEATLAACIERLKTLYGKQLADADCPMTSHKPEAVDSP